MLRKNKLRLGAVAVAVLATVGFGAVSANADPTPGTFKTLSGVGSDTTQDMVAGLSTVIPAIGSYDATGSSTIQTKAGGPLYTRPNGSGAGVTALSRSIDGAPLNGVTITGQIDFARSSSGPSGTGTALTYIPFAKDAVSFAVNAASDFPRDISVGSAAQDAASPAPFTLRNIYRCTVTKYTDGDGGEITIRPLLPQTGSGTRSFWISTLGLTEATLGSCVTDLGNTVEEHDGKFVTGAGDIVPFSVAQYIAQGNWRSLPTSVIERRGGIELGKIGGAKPFTPTSTGAVLNTVTFPITRNVYNVVQTSRLTEPAIAQTFVGTGSDVCTNAAIITKYGFGTIGSLCGNTTTFKAPLR